MFWKGLLHQQLMYRGTNLIFPVQLHQKGRWKVLSVEPILSRVPLQVLYVLVNLHLKSSNKLNCCVLPYQALYVTSHLENSTKKLSFISPNILLLFILELHSLCQNLLLEQTEFLTDIPALWPLHLQDGSLTNARLK